MSRKLLPGASSTRGLLLVVLLATPLPAFAQGGAALNPARPQVGTAPQARPREAPPPALPGARAEPTAVAPPEGNAGDMPPTEALFDAINRGDIAAARDAISRGADTSARNVLGLTPLDLAVDLGRNDITFVLLSFRGGGSDSGGGPPPARDASGASPPQQRLTAAERRAREREAREQRRQELLAARAAAAGQSAAASSGAAASPRLYARDGGAPVPQAGFLGFDPVR